MPPDAQTGVAPAADAHTVGAVRRARAPGSATFRALAWSQDDDLVADPLPYTGENPYDADTISMRQPVQYVPADRPDRGASRLATAAAVGLRAGRGGGAGRRRRRGDRVDERDRRVDDRTPSTARGEKFERRIAAGSPACRNRHRRQRSAATGAATHHRRTGDDDARDHHDDAADHHDDYYDDDDHNDDNDHHDNDVADHDDPHDDHDDHDDHAPDDDELPHGAVSAGADPDSGAAEPVPAAACAVTGVRCLTAATVELVARKVAPAHAHATQHRRVVVDEADDHARHQSRQDGEVVDGWHHGPITAEP